MHGISDYDLIYFSQGGIPLLMIWGDVPCISTMYIMIPCISSISDIFICIASILGLVHCCIYQGLVLILSLVWLYEFSFIHHLLSYMDEWETRFARHLRIFVSKRFENEKIRNGWEGLHVLRSIEIQQQMCKVRVISLTAMHDVLIFCKKKKFVTDCKVWDYICIKTGECIWRLANSTNNWLYIGKEGSFGVKKIFLYRLDCFYISEDMYLLVQIHV